MRAVITGVAGFVGRHLAAHLLDLGWQVHGTHRRPLEARDGALAARGLRHHELDVCQAEACQALLGELSPVACFHLAGEASPGRARRDPGAALTANVLGTWNLARAFGAAGGEVMVFASTSHVYGSPRGAVIDETHPLVPRDAYAVSKLAAEDLLVRAAALHGFREVRLRLFNHIGPGQGPGFVVPDLARRLLLEPPPIAVGNLAVLRDFTDVRDMARAYALAASTPAAAGAYNVGRGEAVPVRALLEGLAAALGRASDHRPDPALLRGPEPPELRADPARFGRVTGWRAEIPLAVTLAEVADEARAAAGG